METRSVPKITNDLEILKKTISNMMYVKHSDAMRPEILFAAMTRLPLTTFIIYDKIYGRWIFTNEHEDEWDKVMSGNHIAGPNFTFVERYPEMAIIKGLHYYYHTKISD